MTILCFVSSSTKTIRLLAFDLYEVTVNSQKYRKCKLIAN